MRSFSELELNANPSQRLNLACMAKCEPICSIGWLLNGRMLGQPIKISSSRAFKSIESGDKNFIGLRRVAELELDSQTPGGALISVDILSRRLNDSWTSETSIGSTRHSRVSLDPGNLRRELDPTGQTGANVFGKLELTYNQLQQLLARSSMEGIVIACRLKPTIRLNGPNQMKYSSGLPLRTAFFEPFHWFPDRNIDTLLTLDTRQNVSNWIDSDLMEQNPLEDGNESGQSSGNPDENVMRIRIILDSKSNSGIA